MSSGSTRRPAGVRSRRAEHLLLVREVLERAGLDDAARHGVDADPARRELDAEVAHDRLERRLRRPDEHVVLEHALRAEARDRDDRRALVGIAGAVARASDSSARAFAFIVQSQCLSSVSSAGRITPVAALCTTHAIRPVRRELLDDPAPTRRCRARAPARRPPRAAPPPPPRRPRRCACSRSRRAWRRRATSRSAIARPIPREPPVTRTDAPSRLIAVRERLVGRRGARHLVPARPRARLAPALLGLRRRVAEPVEQLHLLLGVAAHRVVRPAGRGRAPARARGAGTRNAASRARRGRRCRRGSARPSRVSQTR